MKFDTKCPLCSEVAIEYEQAKLMLQDMRELLAKEIKNVRNLAAENEALLVECDKLRRQIATARATEQD